MHLPYSVTQKDLFEILLNIAPSRPVFIWGAPGIGKSALVEIFAEAVGVPCVSLLVSQLAHWFSENIPPLAKHRSYARPSRRQGATPDIPRAGYVTREPIEHARTFGVVIDTSGSMSAKLIGMALGSIASYAASRDVPFARIVFCDAHAYDAGYLAPDEITGRVEVKGRGGTKLQPGIDLVETVKDFPETGPILIITDGEIEGNLSVHRKHAYLLPKGRHLPFQPKGEVFYFE